MASGWHFQVFGEELGPVSLEELARLVAQGMITRDTSVCAEGDEFWRKAGDLAALFPEPPSATAVALPTSEIVAAEQPAPVPDLPEPETSTAEPSPAEPITEEAVSPDSTAPRWSWQAAAPWTASAAAHAVLLVALAWWVIPLIKQSSVLEWDLALDHELRQPLAALDSEQTTPGVLATGGTLASTEVRLGASGIASFAPTFNLELADSATTAAAGMPRRSVDSWSTLPNVPLNQPVAPGPATIERGTVTQATNIETAVGGLVSEIRHDMAETDLLVVWLMDASLSLWDDRQQMANILEPFFEEFDGRDDDPDAPLLINAAVAYGSVTQEIVAPIRFGKKILPAMRQAPIDPSGVENVMFAVQQCIEEYRSRAKGGMLIIVWTDESGDDTQALEETIAICQRRGVKVSIVGPSSVFGSERGAQSWVDRATGQRFLLPVKRGPDTSLPERVLLPYWHDSGVSSWSRNGAMVDTGSRYGGPHRERLMSGFGPYALTRLAIETGGDYTIFDQRGNESEFSLAAIREYQPDYGSAADYLRSLKYSPLRQAVSAAVITTYQQVIESPPLLQFVVGHAEEYPFGETYDYYSPVDFRSELDDQLVAEQRRAAAALQIVNRALSQFGKEDLETEYYGEDSPRWRAWYDLTRGRLLAAKIRYAEYITVCNLILKSGGLRPDTNRLVLHPSAELRTGSSEMAAEAERLLKRCMEQNRGTPWERLAKWELAHPVGIAIEQIVVPRPTNSGTPTPRRRSAPAPRVNLPRL